MTNTNITTTKASWHAKAATVMVCMFGMALAAVEFGQYVHITPQEHSAAVLGSVSVRMQYAATAWEAIKQSNWWLGVDSIGFPQAYQAAATVLGVTPQSWAMYNWGNPHNEYLYMLATKGVVGSALYWLSLRRPVELPGKKQMTCIVLAW